MPNNGYHAQFNDDYNNDEAQINAEELPAQPYYAFEEVVPAEQFAEQELNQDLFSQQYEHIFDLF